LSPQLAPIAASRYSDRVAWFLRVFLLLAVALSVRGDPALDSALRLYHTKNFAAATAALEAIVAADPQNAAACHALGLALSHRGDRQANDAALPWLEKAMKLAPANSTYVGDYGGTCLELADEHRSFSFATRGRDGLERAVQLDANNLDARDGLMQFYARAPWPLGSDSRARTQAEEIARRNPAQALRTYLRLGLSFEKAGDRKAARVAYAAALRFDPASPQAAAALARLGPPVGPP
jgi:Flp pilus assembly protein TadD